MPSGKKKKKTTTIGQKPNLDNEGGLTSFGHLIFASFVNEAALLPDWFVKANILIYHWPIVQDLI